ncbi:MAG TPA: hypothetical protein VNF46_03775 [Gammaproteobacteria bacterium]|nr:hypothetical protein [Gammaproteobacteria bacterium]
MDAASAAAYKSACEEAGHEIVSRARHFRHTETGEILGGNKSSRGFNLAGEAKIVPTPTKTEVTSIYANIPIYFEGRLRNQADILADIGDKHKLFHDSVNEGYAQIPLNGHKEVHKLDSRSYREILAGIYYELVKKGCNRNALKDALTTLNSKAKFTNEMREVWRRVAIDGNNIILDMGTPDWKVICISAKGWEENTGSTVMFQRMGKPQALPVPAKNGDFNKLWKYLNVREADRVLVAAWILMALNPRGPYPILCLSGEQGSGKSMQAKLLKRLTDPTSSPLRAPPKNIDDLMVGAHNSWVLCLDNLSYLSAQMSDALCRISTGGALSGRTLYTNNEETSDEIMRPQIINGIEDLAQRPDLANRAIQIELDAIPTVRREAEMLAAFGIDLPDIFGGLLDGLAMALHGKNDAELKDLPRMADFACWAAAGLPALGFDRDAFLAAYKSSIADGQNRALESSTVGRAIQKLIENCVDWQNTAAELLATLNAFVDPSVLHSHVWPKSIRSLYGHLNRIAPALRDINIHISKSRVKNVHMVHVCKVGKYPAQAAQAAEPAPDKASSVPAAAGYAGYAGLAAGLKISASPVDTPFLPDMPDMPDSSEDCTSTYAEGSGVEL